jgi:hypothetical protein
LGFRTLLLCTSALSLRIKAEEILLTGLPSSSAHRAAIFLMVIADGGHNLRQIRRLHPYAGQDRMSQKSTGLSLSLTIDHIADIVQISGDAGQIDLPLGKAQFLQYSLCSLGHPPGMALSMFGISNDRHGLIGHFDHCFYFRVLTDLLPLHHRCSYVKPAIPKATSSVDV